MSKTEIILKLLIVFIIIKLIMSGTNLLIILLIGVIYYFHREIGLFCIDLFRSTSDSNLSLNKIYNESHDHNCVSCTKKISYRTSSLYEQFGSCGGYEDGLYLTCIHCNHINKIYTSNIGE